MGVTIQFESHRVELAGIYEMEHDTNVLEYFDQPPPIKLDYKTATGKRMGVLHTPDFFVIRERKAGWEEWKTEETLSRLAAQNPNRYCAGAEGRWHCPPGATHAEQLGLYYRVRSSMEIDWTFQRNIQFLEDYLRAGSATISPASRETAAAHVSATPGVTLEALLQLTKDQVPSDDIFSMIAANILYVDLRAAPLAEPWRVGVFATPEAAKIPRCEGVRKPQPIHSTTLCCGNPVNWDGRPWKIVNVGESSTSLLSLADDRRLIELPLTVYEALIGQGRIEAVPCEEHDSNTIINEKVSRASEADLRVANRRARIINGYLTKGIVPADVPRRTLTRWVGQYRQAETIHGSGFLGLLPHSARRGNSTPKLSEASRRLLEEFICQDYETLKQKTRYASWIALKLSCENQGITAPSYKTFCVAVRRRPSFEQTVKRKGRRASYQVEVFYWELDQKTPRHGDRPFEIVHIDHTPLDIELISQSGQVLGRPWMTVLTDAFSRRTLAFYLTFDAPSYRSCMMVLRECVRRFGRFPQILVMDGGREFGSTYLETLLARYESMKKTRPSAKARFGSICERLLGVANTQFIHNLRGNTQINQNVRQITKSVDPKRLAIWPLAELHQRLCEYLYDVHDTLQHPALGQSPRQAFQEGLTRGGPRLHRMISYNEEFLMLTLPTTPKGTAKVTPSRGVKINHIYYWCEAFRNLETQGERVSVRYDPFDAGIAFAFVRKQWVQCHSEYYAVLKDRSEREIMLATKELHQQHHNHSAEFTVTARRLAEFLQSVEAEESLLTQRLCDCESRAIRLALNGGANKGSSTPSRLDGQTTEIDGRGFDDAAVGEVYREF
ncbi:MAG: Mu transposase C-terminal domain-containing protein [Candidatus Acidiferrales bacterium]